MKKYFLSLSTLALAGFLLSSPALASEIVDEKAETKSEIVQVSAHSSSEIDNVIKQQLQAIRERNDRVAYELNTADVKEEFEDPQSFMRDIRRKKGSLYNHVGYEIIPSHNAASKFHKVKLTDKFGKSVMALFKMEQSENGEWKTNNIVVLTPSDDPI